MTSTDLRERLLRRRWEILGCVRGLTDTREPAGGASDDVAAGFAQILELDNLDVLFRIDLATRRELNQINHALERMDSGHYGQCRDCGGAIGLRRLRASPCAETCAACDSTA